MSPETLHSSTQSSSVPSAPSHDGYSLKSLKDSVGKMSDAEKEQLGPPIQMADRLDSHGVRRGGGGGGGVGADAADSKRPRLEGT